MSGTDMVFTTVEYASAQAIKDTWLLKHTGQSLAGPLFTSSLPRPLAECQNHLQSQGFTDGIPDASNVYTYERALGDFISGQYKVTFFNPANAPTDICRDYGTAHHFQVDFTGTAGMGNSMNLTFLVQSTSTPVLNGRVSGEAGGQPYQMVFQNYQYASLLNDTPDNGQWTGMFAENTPGACDLSLTFSGGNGSGSMSCGSGKSYQVTVAGAGAIEVKQ